MSRAPERDTQMGDLRQGDVVRILLDQHLRVGELFARVASTSGEEKQQLFNELRRLLAVHEVAEEMIVRPVTRVAAGGGPVASARNAEERNAARRLSELEKLDISSMAFAKAFATFQKDVLEHARLEEAEEFPLVVSTRSKFQRMALGTALQATELVAPTHPHPAAAGSTVAQYVLGPFASLLDHSRDALRVLLPRR